MLPTPVGMEIGVTRLPRGCRRNVEIKTLYSSINRPVNSDRKKFLWGDMGMQASTQGMGDRSPIYGLDGTFCLLCALVHTLLQYNAMTAFSSKPDSAGNTEMRLILPN